MATASSTDPAGPAAARVLDLIRSRPPTLGPERLLCVDGPAGSGKTTLAHAVAARAAGAVVVSTDDLLDGWGGLPGLPGTLLELAAPLACAESSSYRRYDWHAGAYAERVTVPRSPLLVLEGVGSGTRLLDPWRTVLVWVSAPDDLRLARGLARDGAALEPEWRRWLAAEAEHFARERTAERADLHVDGAVPG